MPVIHDILIATAHIGTGTTVQPVKFLVFQERTNLVSHRLLVSEVPVGLSTRVLITIKPNTSDWYLMKHLFAKVLKVGL